MKKLITVGIVLATLLLPAAAQSAFQREEVSIYADLDNGLFGRSLNRNVTLTVKDRQFLRSATYYVGTEAGNYVTAVTINAAVVSRLNNAMQSGRSLMIGEFELSIDEAVMNPMSSSNAYRLQSRRTGLDMTFGFAKPTPAMIRMIETYYQNMPAVREEVVNYYNNNYIIVIYAAENIFESWNHEITFADGMLAATLIGDREQLLWGVHNGNGLLARIMAQVSVRG
jgi:hypothetical protein